MEGLKKCPLLIFSRTEEFCGKHGSSTSTDFGVCLGDACAAFGPDGCRRFSASDQVLREKHIGSLLHSGDAEGAVPMLGVPKKRKNAAKRTWRPKPCPYNDAITCDAVECLPECGWRNKNTVEES